MIAVTMRLPDHAVSIIRNMVFEEPHWSAAKDLIRTLKSQGWSLLEVNGLHGDMRVSTVNGFVRMEPIKPPFDPLAAGWRGCRTCAGKGEVGFMEPCGSCDGLGIVVGPPEDGLEIARSLHISMDSEAKFPIPDSIMPLVRRANDYRR
jgi:hypothetical protein